MNKLRTALILFFILFNIYILFCVTVSAQDSIIEKIDSNIIEDSNQVSINYEITREKLFNSCVKKCYGSRWYDGNSNIEECMQNWNCESCLDNCWKKYGNDENRRPQLEDKPACFINIL